MMVCRMQYNFIPWQNKDFRLLFLMSFFTIFVQPGIFRKKGVAFASVFECLGLRHHAKYDGCDCYIDIYKLAQPVDRRHWVWKITQWCVIFHTHCDFRWYKQEQSEWIHFRERPELIQSGTHWMGISTQLHWNERCKMRRKFGSRLFQLSTPPLVEQS